MASESDSGDSRPGRPEQLATEIEQTREDLAATLDAIAEKVSPKRVAKRSTKKVTDTVKETAASAKEAVTHRAAHVAEAAKDTAGAAKGKASDLRDAVSPSGDEPLGGQHLGDVPPDPDGEPTPVRSADVVADAAADAAGSIGAKAHDVAHEVKAAAGHAKDAAATRLHQVKESVSGATPSGHSLSEPGTSSSRRTLQVEVALGAVVAVVGLLLLRRRRSR